MMTEPDQLTPMLVDRHEDEQRQHRSCISIPHSSTEDHKSQLIKTMYDALMKSHKELQKKYDDEKAKYKKDFESLGKKYTEAKNQTDAVQERNSELEMSLQQTKIDREHLQTELSLTMTERKAVLEEIRQLHDEVSKLNIELQSVYGDLRKNEAERKESEALLNAIRLERDMLNKSNIQIQLEKDDALKEAVNQTKWRELAFQERDKCREELEDCRQKYDKVSSEREGLVKQLEEAVKENDMMRETKNKIQVELHKANDRLNEATTALHSIAHHTPANSEHNIPSSPRASPSSGGQKNSANSHDSAIDASASDLGDGGSGDSETPTSNTVTSNHRSEVCFEVTISPKEYELEVKQAVLITRSNLDKIQLHDRIMEIDRKAIAAMSFREVQKAINSEKAHNFRIQRDIVSFSRTNGYRLSGRTLDGKLSSTFTSSPVCVASPVESKNRKNKRLSIPTPSSLPPNGSAKDVNTVMTQQPSPKKELRNGNNDDGSDPTPKKRRPKNKITGSWFMSRKKKSKSGSSEKDSHRTWPRIDSPHVNDGSTPNHNTTVTDEGAVAAKPKKRPRPPLSLSVFDPPIATRTPVIETTSASIVRPLTPRNDVAKNSQRLSLIGNENTERSSKARMRVRTGDSSQQQRKMRPTSAPIDPHPNLSMWPEDINLDDVTSTVNKSQRCPMVKSNNQEDDVQSKKSSNRTTSKPVVSQSCALPPASPNFPYKKVHTLPTPLSRPMMRERQQSVPESGIKKPFHTSGVKTMPPDICAKALREVTWPEHYHKAERRIRAKPGVSRDKMKTPRVRLPGSQCISPNCSTSTISNSNVTINSTQSSPFTVLAQTTTVPDCSIGSLVSNSSSSMSSRSRPPVTSEPRLVKMLRGVGDDFIGITIGHDKENDGIFITSLTENSPAAHAGLRYMDQLLEFNGINLRKANEPLALSVMRNMSGEITFLVQYKSKHKVSIESNLSDNINSAPIRLRNNGMKPINPIEEREGTITPDVTPRASPHIIDSVKQSNSQLANQPVHEERLVLVDGEICKNIELTGGNHVGIFVSIFKSEDTTSTKSHIPNTDLRMGDRIIKFNNVEFDNMTLERASILMSQPPPTCTFVVKYEPNKYKQSYAIPGDHFYVRALFDQSTPREGYLKFVKNTILLVEKTFLGYTPGNQWEACILDEQGNTKYRGKIPSKTAVEKEREMILMNDDTASCSANSASSKRLNARRSFFKRRNRPNRTSSRSSGEVRVHRSTSETSVESAAIDTSFDGPILLSPVAYQVVEKYHASIRRPVVIFGAHSGVIVERMVDEYPNQFVRLFPEPIQANTQSCEVIENYPSTISGNSFALTKDLLTRSMDKTADRHTLIDISVEKIDNLHAMQIYPIIIFIKYKDYKKVKEAQDRIQGRDKLSTKQCKEMLEKANRIEKNYYLDHMP